MSVVGRAERMADFYAENGEVVGRERLAGTLKISGVGQTGLFGLKKPKQIWELRDLGREQRNLSPAPKGRLSRRVSDSPHNDSRAIV